VERQTVNDVLRKYGARIEGEINSNSEANSSSYELFKDETSREYSAYERWANSLGNIIRINPSVKDESRIRKAIDAAHLSIEPWQAVSLSIMGFLSVFLIGILISVAVVFVNNGDVNSFPLLFFFLMIFFAIFLFSFLNSYPDRIARKWRLKASSQMVPAILYIVVYMRHTSNLEKAIQFASEHLDYPLALDFKKIFYNIEVGKYSTIKESLDNYLETWRGYSNEFIESFHLIESSLFEPDEGRRISTLEKGLQVVLDGVYEKMLSFSHSVRSPLTNVYMLGVVLPTLGLALIPLASAMIGGLLTYIHVFILFNLIIPFMVFYLTDKALSLRPGGYGETALLEKNPLYLKYKSQAPYRKAFLIAFPLFLISLTPLLFEYTPLPVMLGVQKDYTFAQLGLSFLGSGNIFNFVSNGTGVTGPFGLGALLLGMLLPISISIFFSVAYSGKTKELILERKKTKELESEFNNSLFQLGNRLGNGVPPELVFGKVAEANKELQSGEFFARVNYNIQQMGMGVEEAIFDKKRGAIRFFPSSLIATSMRILVESAKKGLKIAAVSLMSISEYIKNLDKITERLKDLLAEIISDMKSNMTFLAPLLSGIVVGLAAMITAILGMLNLNSLSSSTGGAANLGTLTNLLNIFQYQYMIPPYFLQIAVGLYLVEITFILTSTLVTIDSGEDRLELINKTGQNLKRGMSLYFIVALLSVIALSILSSVVIGNLL
jgi:Flp pilus assembly protein TadB